MQNRKEQLAPENLRSFVDRSQTFVWLAENFFFKRCFFFVIVLGLFYHNQMHLYVFQQMTVKRRLFNQSFRHFTRNLELFCRKEWWIANFVRIPLLVNFQHIFFYFLWNNVFVFILVLWNCNKLKSIPLKPKYTKLFAESYKFLKRVGGSQTADSWPCWDIFALLLSF